MRSKKQQKTGTAVVELAVCLPVIFAVVFGSIEACNMIALKQIICESAYDGALVAVRPNSTEADIVSSINAVLAARNVTPQTVSVTGPGGISFNAISRGDPITVTVEALTDGNIVGPQPFGFASMVSGAATGIKQ